MLSQSVHPKGSQPWIFMGRTDAEALILWPPDAESQLTGKDADAGKDWRQENRATEDEMFRWHHRLSECDFEQTLGGSEEQGSLVQRVGHNWATKHDVLYLNCFSKNTVLQFIKLKTPSYLITDNRDRTRRNYRMWSNLYWEETVQF